MAMIGEEKRARYHIGYQDAVYRECIEDLNFSWYNVLIV